MIIKSCYYPAGLSHKPDNMTSLYWVFGGKSLILCQRIISSPYLSVISSWVSCVIGVICWLKMERAYEGWCLWPCCDPLIVGQCWCKCDVTWAAYYSKLIIAIFISRQKWLSYVVSTPTSRRLLSPSSKSKVISHSTLKTWCLICKNSFFKKPLLSLISKLLPCCVFILTIKVIMWRLSVLFITFKVI